MSARPPAGAYLTIDGRRWRCSDPDIPPAFRQELVNELMAARRAVAAASSEADRKDGRRRVNDAKVALGERGRAWWLPPLAADRHRRIEAAIRALLRSRRPGSSICPSDIARIVGGQAWRQLMPTVRERGAALAAAGEIDVLRRGAIVHTEMTTGVLRYRLRGDDTTAR